MTDRHVDYAELQRRRTASRAIRELQLPPGVVCVPYGAGEWERYAAVNGCSIVIDARHLSHISPTVLDQWDALLKLSPAQHGAKLWLTAAGRPFIVWNADGVTYTLLGKPADTSRVVGIGW